MPPRTWTRFCSNIQVIIGMIFFIQLFFSYSTYYFTEYDQPHESQTNKDIMEAISRKGLSGLCGPDSPDGDDYPIGDSPRNDSNNDNDYPSIIQNRNQINSGGKYLLNFCCDYQTCTNHLYLF